MIELLAPAGSFDALKAAVESGADAVYLAGEKFGARAYAENFAGEQLLKAVEFAHLRGVAVHVTVNTLIADEELDEFAEYLKFLRRANVDALLVQDLGAAALAKKFAPEIPLHASTQMTIHNAEGVKALAELGFSRAVLSRELTLEEIKKICRESPIETEIFIHGALCVCWSGQCLMSSLIGGRSGNRGRCAQPCRLPYELVDDSGKNLLNAGKYLLSPKDLNTLELLPKLLETGVTSLKIEGRMKRPEYVATVVKVYRDALDKNFSTADDRRKLAQIFNRDFTTAYLEKNPGKNLISDMKPNNRGVLIGRVVEVGRDKITLKLAEKLHAGDQVEIWIKVGGRVTFTVEEFDLRGDLCTIKTNAKGVRVHDRAFKIFDAELTAEARKYFTGAPVRKIAVAAEVAVKLGEPLTLTLTDSDGNSATARTNFIAEPAKNRPLTLETLKNQLGRLGNSIFALEKISAALDENLMIPISELNDVRRRAVEQLETLRLKKFEREKISINDETFPLIPDSRPLTPSIIAHVDTPDKLKAALDAGADEILFGGETFTNQPVKNFADAINFAHLRGKKISLATPRIVRENELAALEKTLSAAVDAIYIHNLATLSLVKKFSAAPIRSDFSLHVFNAATINFLKNLGIEGVTLSPELNLTQVKDLAKKSPLPVECIVHGQQELMISAYCVLGSFLGELDKKNCPRICRAKNFYLRDRKDELFPVVTDQFCRMHILNAKTLSMIEHRADFDGVARLRVDCRALTLNETAQIVRAYKVGGAEIENFTRGHYFRGVM